MDPAEIVREFAGLATEPGAPAERAAALLERLHRVLRADAGLITVSGPEGYATLARAGYDARVCGYLDGPAFGGDVELSGLHGAGRPLRLRDLPVPSTDLVGWVEYLEPAGFRDGVGVPLFAGPGRYLGVVGLTTAAEDGVTAEARDLLGLLATPIAAGVDPWRSLATLAGVVERATAGIVLTPPGHVRPLPGLPGHHLLDTGSDVLAAAVTQLGEGGSPISFLAPVTPNGAAPAEDAGTHVRITALAAPPDARRFATAVVLASPAAQLHGLSPQELQVLGLLVTGASNERIGVALGITRRTVEGHVDHVRAKLAARSRAAAVARALRLGLFVPPALFVRRSARVPPGGMPS